MADSPRRCGMASCGSTDGVRLFVPDVLLARHRARLAELAKAGAT